MLKDIKDNIKGFVGAEYGSREKTPKGMLVFSPIFCVLAVAIGTWLVKGNSRGNIPNLIALWYCVALFGATSLWVLGFYFYVKSEKSDRCERVKKALYYAVSTLLVIVFLPVILILAFSKKGKLSINQNNLFCYMIIIVISLFSGAYGVVLAGSYLAEKIENWHYLDLSKFIVLLTILVIYLLGKLVLAIWKCIKKIPADEYKGVRSDLNSLWYAVMVVIAILINIFAIPSPWDKVITSMNGIFVIYFALDRLITTHKKTHDLLKKDDAKG